MNSKFVSRPTLGVFVRPRRTVLALATAAFTMGAVPAMAEACTPSTAGTQALKQFGDNSQYTLAPGGSFESGTSGWTLSGSTVQNGNESYKVNGSSNSHSLLIPAKSKPVSATICVSTATPFFRFFGRLAGGSWAQMNVNVLWTDASGVAHSTTAGSFQPTSSSWVLSPVFNLATTLPLWQSGSTLSVRLQFVPQASGGAIGLDDVEIDPYSKR